MSGQALDAGQGQRGRGRCSSNYVRNEVLTACTEKAGNLSVVQPHGFRCGTTSRQSSGRVVCGFPASTSPGRSTPSVLGVPDSTFLIRGAGEGCALQKGIGTPVLPKMGCKTILAAQNSFITHNGCLGFQGLILSQNPS